MHFSRIVRHVFLAALVALAVPSAGVSVVAAPLPILALMVSGSPFAASMAPLPASVTVNLAVSVQALTKLVVTRTDGRLVSRLIPRQTLAAGAYLRSWSGTNSHGAVVPDGEYLIKAVSTSSGATQTVTRRIRKGLPLIYPANPAAIVIAVDPGHGGRFLGGHGNGYAEKVFNLDIGLKLRQLLVQAGVQVVISRTTDSALNEPETDRNDDGMLNRYDDDLLRNDSKNSARADVAVHVHNNDSSNPAAHGTGTYIPRGRTWTPIARELATDVVAEQFTALAAYTSPGFVPKYNGVRYGRFYYYMARYDPPFLARPSLVTSVLSESLYMSNAAELDMLERDDVRTSLAGAIYIGLARWLNSRPLGVGYELLSGPAGLVTAGSALEYDVRVTNRGNVASDGWVLQLHNVPAVPLYDGSGQTGSFMGEAAVPDGLQPGQSVDLKVEAEPPAGVGDWLVKADVQLPGGGYASALGVVPLQMSLTTDAP